MPALCDAAIHLCAVRATRLDPVGNPSGGPNNVYVTDKPIMLSVTPQIEAGADKMLIGGCDCIIANYRGFDKLKRFDFELDLGVIEPGLLEMLLGTPAILDASGNPIGANWVNQLECQQPSQPNVAIEGWQTLWEDDHPASSPYKYLRWIWTSTHWQVGAFSLQNDFNQPKLTGYSRSNPAWGLGIYGDQPESVLGQGAFWYDNTIPAAACGYQTRNIT